MTNYSDYQCICQRCGVVVPSEEMKNESIFTSIHSIYMGHIYCKNCGNAVKREHNNFMEGVKEEYQVFYPIEEE
jgi:hypothetical protein